MELSTIKYVAEKMEDRFQTAYEAEDQTKSTLWAFLIGAFDGACMWGVVVCSIGVILKLLGGIKWIIKKLAKL